jgi:hypothetical protein
VVASDIASNAITEAKIADNAITLAKMAHGTDGEIITYDTSGNPTTVPVGTSAQVLTSNGAGATPTFQDAAGGKVLQVVGSSKETTTSVSSTSFISSGLYATITPSSTSSKILILITGTVGINATGNAPYGTIYRGSTNLSTTGDGGFFHRYPNTGTGIIAINYLDSPSTTSATTYALYVKQVNGGSATWFNGGKGAITLMEIGA